MKKSAEKGIENTNSEQRVRTGDKGYGGKSGKVILRRQSKHKKTRQFQEAKLKHKKKGSGGNGRRLMLCATVEPAAR